MSTVRHVERQARAHPPVHHGGHVVAASLTPAFEHRTWVITAASQRCHAVLLDRGRVRLAIPNEPDVELNGPSLLWLPPATAAEYSLLAGGGGATFSVAESLAWRTVADSPVGMQLRPLLSRILIVPGERIGSHMKELAVSFEAMARESRENQSASNAMISAHLALVLLHMWRAGGLAETPRSAKRAGGATVQRFRQLVEVHYREHMGINDYARLLNVTRSHLHDVLRQVGRAHPARDRSGAARRGGAHPARAVHVVDRAGRLQPRLP